MSEGEGTDRSGWQSLDAVLNQQSAITGQSRKLIEPLHRATPDIRRFTGEHAAQVKDLMLELEVLQAEERALLNRLFPEAGFWVE